MPQFVLKPNPNYDRYVYWDTVTDSPWFHGDRVQMLDYLRVNNAWGDGQRIARAINTGTSSQDGLFGWTADMQGTAVYLQDGLVLLTSLWELAERLRSGEDVADLLRPFET